MKCPGQDSRYWKPGAIFEENCPKCGHAVEFFKDDTSRKCGNCGHRFINPKMDFGCASYCEFAEQCLGTLPPELLSQKEDLLKDRVALEMKRYFKTDFRRIEHATRVAYYAERIGKKEGGNLAVILVAAYLHDIGIHEAEKKHQSAEAKYHEKEGPAIARSMMTHLGAKAELIEAVCDIIDHHHHPRADETTDFKVVYDSDFMVNLEEKQKENCLDKCQIGHMVETSFLTESGRQEALAVFAAEEDE